MKTKDFFEITEPTIAPSGNKIKMPLERDIVIVDVMFFKSKFHDGEVAFVRLNNIDEGDFFFTGSKVIIEQLKKAVQYEAMPLACRITKVKNYYKLVRPKGDKK